MLRLLGFLTEELLEHVAQLVHVFVRRLTVAGSFVAFHELVQRVVHSLALAVHNRLVVFVDGVLFKILGLLAVLGLTVLDGLVLFFLSVSAVLADIHGQLSELLRVCIGVSRLGSESEAEDVLPIVFHLGLLLLGC